MKVAVECQSPLLQRSLELFLERYLVSKKSCDIVIKDTVGTDSTDEKKSFYIGTTEEVDLIKPFSKSQLILALQKFHTPQKSEVLQEKSSEDVEEKKSEGNKMDFEILERRIEMLTKEYQQNIINAVKAFYEN